MEVLLFFYGHWRILGELLTLGGGAPRVRLTIAGAGAADGEYFDPPPGWSLEADGPEWTLRLDLSFDQQPFQYRELLREFRFDPATGLIALVRSFSPPNPVFFAEVRLKCVSIDRELTSEAPQTPDFTIPERDYPPPP